MPPGSAKISMSSSAEASYNRSSPSSSWPSTATATGPRPSTGGTTSPPSAPPSRRCGPAWACPISIPADPAAVQIYIGSTDKRLYSFNSVAGPATSDWPQFRRDAQRNGRAPAAVVVPPGGRLINLSVRTTAGADADTLIVGFVVSGVGGRAEGETTSPDTPAQGGEIKPGVICRA